MAILAKTLLMFSLLSLLPGCDEEAKQPTQNNVSRQKSDDPLGEQAPTPSSEVDKTDEDKTTASTSNSDETKTAPKASLPQNIIVSGQLGLSSQTIADLGDVGLSERPIELVDQSGTTVATAKAQASGVFTLAIDTSSLQLTNSENVSLSGLLTIKSLSLGAKKAIGVKRQIFLDPNAITTNENGENSLGLGSFEIKKVGAIVGQITLQTGEDPTGIEVYVPGTTYIAKTDAEGKYILGFMPQGSFQIRADRDGYTSLEWQNIKVGKNETTIIPPTVMKIGNGPKIISFDPNPKSSVALSQSLNVTFQVEGATKYRLSQLSDFRDTVYQPLDFNLELHNVSLQLTPGDGLKTVYLQVADSDGLVASQSFDILLDTQAPLAPSFSIVSDGSKSGYTNTKTPTLKLTSCDDIDSLFVTENSSVKPAVGDFSTKCADVLKNGKSITLSNGDGTKTVYLWVKDLADRISDQSKSLEVILDTVNPVLNLTPSINFGTDTILTKETTELILSGNESVDIYYTFNLSSPTTSSQKLATASGIGRLVLIDDATLKAIAVDPAGNQSAEVSRNIVIDRNAPLLGSISATTNDGLLNNLNVNLTVQAQGASKMRFAETIEGLQSGDFVNYTTTYVYPLTNTTDGEKKIYVVFSDDAGNLHGSGGEIYTSFTLDRTAPSENKITLLEPESPTGAFNTPLVWKEDFENDSDITYVVEVHSTSSYDNLARSMTTTNTSVNIDPPLDSAGTYYWRVRAQDKVGNATNWVNSGNSMAFTVNILAQSYQAKKIINGKPGEHRYFGRQMLLVDDLTEDNVSEVAVSIMEATFSNANSSCSNCGLVRIYDKEQKTALYDIDEGLPSFSAFGHKIARCNVFGGSGKELIVTAPGHNKELNGVIYNNVGSVYVYDPDNQYALVDVIEPDLVVSNPLPGYFSCATYSAENTCIEYGWKMWPSPIIDWINSNDSRYFGWSLDCLPSASSAISNNTGLDGLLIGEPFYHDGTTSRGRVSHYEFIDGSFTKIDQILGGTEQSQAGFGMAIAYLNNFKYSGCPAASSIAIGRPMKLVSGIEMGSVSIYQYNGSEWSECAVIDADSTADPNYCRYGQGLFNLGDIDKDGSIEELAISGSCYSGGVVRIFGGSSGSNLKTYLSTSDEFLGYQVASAGDFNSDGNSELAISVPGAKVNGQWSSGKILILDWATMDDGNNSNGTIIRSITGRPSSWSNLGASFLPILSDSSDIHSTTSSTLISSPGKSVGGDWSVGMIADYALIKMAPSLPTTVEGKISNENLGSAIVPISDMNADGVADVILGRPGGLCNGAPTGNISVYSVFDGVFSSQICGDFWSSRRYIGQHAAFFAQNDAILFFEKGTGYVVSKTNFSSYPSVEDANDYPASKKIFTDWNESTYSEPRTIAPDWIDEVLIGAPKFWDAGPNNGKVSLYHYDGGSISNECAYKSDTDNAYFGRGLSFINDLNGDGVRDVLIGAPGLSAGGSNGVVYIIDGTMNPISGCAGQTHYVIDEANTSGLVLATIAANHADIVATLGKEANKDFGSFVLGLPDYDGPGGPRGYFFVANTNIRIASSSVTPQYLIVRINADYSFTVMSHDTGVSGGMLGSFAKVLEDINGDSKPELAVSYPGGTGRLGQTGHVRILSGLGLSTTDQSDDLIQKLFSSAQASSNFGYSFEYVDMTGDGLKDFVVGANLYSGSYQNNGALFVYPMVPIQN